MANVAVSKTAIPNCINASTETVIVQNVRYQDIVNGGTFADNDTATLTLPIAAGQAVVGVGVKLITAFTDSGSGDELNVTVGDGTDPDGFVLSAQLHSADTPITYVYNTGAYIDTETSKLYLVAGTVDILITPNVTTGTDYSLDELTAGEFEVKLFLRDLNS
jgi:hypothetical protein